MNAAAASSTIALRDYQREAVEAVYAHLRSRDDNPCVVLPTAAGKSWIIAQICSDAVERWQGRVLVLAHVKELLEQTAEKLRIMAPALPIGIYSAGLKRRDLGYAVTIASIQSVYTKACDLGPIDLVLVDEAHRISPDGESAYRTLLTDLKTVNPNMRVIGLTATPFRMKSGMICSPESILNEICYEIGIRELIVQGYLCPLRSKAGVARADYDQLHIRGGEFIAGEVEQLMDDDVLVRAACREVVNCTQDRNSVLLFASGVRHARHIVRVFEQDHGLECGFICGETLPLERDALIDRFRRGALKYLVNVNVLTTGFDAPTIDCVALLRPTNSPGLYVQMLGRAFRLHPGKQDALILDFGGNILRHGPVDALRIKDPACGDGEAPAKECPECQAVIHAAYATCPECGYEFPPPERQRHEREASTAGVLTGEVTETEYDVGSAYYTVHVKRDAPEDHPRSMRVEYRLGFNQYVSEWICFEHSGFARAKAEAWWRQRSNEPVPETAAEAVDLAEAGALATTLAVTVRRVTGEKYDRIVRCTLGEKPPAMAETTAMDELPVPF